MKKKWTKFDYRYLIDNYYDMEAVRIAEILGTTDGRVRQVAHMLRKHGFLQIRKNERSQSWDAIQELKREYGIKEVK